MAARKKKKKRHFKINKSGDTNGIAVRFAGNAEHCVAQNLAFMEVTSREEMELFSWSVSTWIIEPCRRFGIPDGKERLSRPVQSRSRASVVA